MKATVPKVDKKTRRDAWKAKQEGLSSDDYSKLKNDMEADFKKESLNDAANKNGWSATDEKDWRQSLKEEQNQNQSNAAKLQKEQERQATATRNNQNHSQPRQVTSAVSGQNASNQETELNIQEDAPSSEPTPEEIEAERKEKEEAIAQADKDLKSDLAKLAEEEAAEIETEKAGRPLPIQVSLFATPVFLIGMMIVDSLLAAIPIMGDFLGLIVSAVVWAIPCVLMFSAGAYVSIWKFFIFDLIFGLVVGTFGNVIPVVGDMLLDAVPELILLVTGMFGGKE